MLNVAIDISHFFLSVGVLEQSVMKEGNSSMASIRLAMSCAVSILFLRVAYGSSLF